MKFSLRRMLHCIFWGLKAEIYFKKCDKISFGENVERNLFYLKKNILHYKTGEEVRFVFNAAFVDKYFAMQVAPQFDSESNMFYFYHDENKTIYEA